MDLQNFTVKIYYDSQHCSMVPASISLTRTALATFPTFQKMLNGVGIVRGDGNRTGARSMVVRKVRWDRTQLRARLVSVSATGCS